MKINSIMNQVISIFLIIIIGFYGSKRKIITKELNKGLTEILTKITLPLMIIASFNITYNSGIKSNIRKTLFYSAIIIVLSIVVTHLLLLIVKDKNKRKILEFGNVFSNCGFMGFPIIESIYGSEGIIYASIFNMFFSIFMWSYGVMLFSDKISIKEIKKVLLNPGVIGVYIGALIMLLNIKMPEVIFSSIKSVGSITTPLSMLIIGSILADINLGGYLKDITIYYGSFIKLIIIPMITLLFFIFIKEDTVVSKTLVILQAMPAAAMTSILAESFNKEAEYAAVFVFMTTFLSVFTFSCVLKIVLKI
ncbi:AEC family transporter [Clostridium ihumii]|uniref:AEC family transporter n=1 Tax=Clostridium ihumii TaxID=1470356 RepID=UPI00058CAFF2|nr:AEC family transporter [Clostridium ihumii]